MVITFGHADSLGATPERDGVNFAVWSSVAERVELCLFDANGQQTVLEMPQCLNGVWHGFVPGCTSGQRYGYRVHGAWDPDAGLRCNPSKLLLDPYARAIAGEFNWRGKVFDYLLDEDGMTTPCNADNADSVPVSVVCSGSDEPASNLQCPWNQTVIYECNLRGFTKLHPLVPAAERGRFNGMRNKDVLNYLKALGITSIEIMPVLTFVDEAHLAEQGLRNYWGYNTVGFFAPMARYGQSDPVTELRNMIRAIHEAGLEVILDVAYNHTAESGKLGPTISFRGIDNLAYYRTEPENAGQYINDTGCGNTINADHPRVQALILDSLKYLHRNIGFDGFRFDLAPVLGRHGTGFSPSHPLLQAITTEPELQTAKMIAEPWDPGPGGYQLGQFPNRWGEWNDAYRDTVRQFWRGDGAKSGALAKRMHGSSDLFEHHGRSPFNSVNLITAHDGFTLTDLVSYEKRHNHANGEDNRDGHQHNYSHNYGAEGRTDDPSILEHRRRQRLNILATLLFSQGTPMLLAGDEFGQTQHGNNNAYAQDNEITWLDWSLPDSDPDFVADVRKLIRLRHDYELLRFPEFIHHSHTDSPDIPIVRWLDKHGNHMSEGDWEHSQTLSVFLQHQEQAITVVLNRGNQADKVHLASIDDNWQLMFSATKAECELAAATDQLDDILTIGAHSVALLANDKAAGQR